MPRGPKVRTALNSPPGARQRIARVEVEPTSTLGADATKEFRRLADVLDGRGCLDRVDLAVLTECARVGEQLDEIYRFLDLGTDQESSIEEKIEVAKSKGKMLQLIAMLTSQKRGLLRELGLTIKPSTTLVRSDAKNNKQSDPIEKRIKIHA